MIRSLAFSVCIGITMQSAAANCKGVPEAYEIVDLGELVNNQAEASAIAINDKGRIIVSALESGFDAKPVDYIGSKPGNFKVMKDRSIEAESRTLALLSREVQLVSYDLDSPDFLSMSLTTLIDRKGGEISVSSWCEPPEAGQKMSSFAVSPSGKHAAAVFNDRRNQFLSICLEGQPARVVREVSDSLTIDRISDDGVMVGRDGDEFWRGSKKDYEPLLTPNGWSQLKVTGVTEMGQLVGSAFGVVTSPSIIVEPDKELQQINILPGMGWDTLWQVLSPCGVLIGEATQTNFEEFLELPVEKQKELRSDLATYLNYAREARSTYFVWSARDPASSGTELHEITPNLKEDWVHITLVAANRKGFFVGHGARHDGAIRAILVKPLW